MIAKRLQAEYLFTPLGLGITKPRFSWNGEGGISQSAYEILVKRGGETIWKSGKVYSSSMTLRPYEGEPFGSRDRIEWSVRLWDEQGEVGPWESSYLEMGLLSPGDWQAKWICGDYKPSKKKRYPVDLFQKTIGTRGTVSRARLYATARGVYDVWIGGERLKDFVLAPGMTDYRKRLQVQTYDVTRFFVEQGAGEVPVVLRLADGWFRGSVAAYGVSHVFGDQTSVIAQLELTYTDGSRDTFVTDQSWQWCNDGPLTFADLKDGEVYDARKTPSWSGRAREVAGPREALLAPSDNVPVKEQERFSPRLLPGGVLDFGQNIAGYLAFSVQGKKGETLRLICGETLDKEGRVDLSGIQERRPAKGWTSLSLIRKLITGKVKGPADVTPHQEILFTCSGEVDEYQTSFAIFGFRYVQVMGEVKVEPEDFSAIAVYSDLEQTGTFTCSDERVNHLVQNTLWSMKGNFLDVPTDCPTRERLGWTGDAQVFFDTGAYLMNTAPFFRKWLRDMRDDTYKNGLISAVIPFSGVEMMYKATGSSVGWADALYLVPWRAYKRFGDLGFLSDAWPGMEKYADYLLSHLGPVDKKARENTPQSAWIYEKGVHLGEWLEPEEFRDKVYGTKARHPEECTAYLYLCMSTMAEIAKVLGKPAGRYEEAAREAKKAYQLVAELDTDRQAKLVRPLALGLLEGEVKKAAQRRLKEAVKSYGHRVGTGFLSTPFLLPVLTEAGEVEDAYKVLLNDQKPGWLYEVEQGATTIWESWEGDLSLNHYSPGAVCQWLFDTVAGIRMEGENAFLLRPLPGQALKHAKASYLSPYGRVESAWRREKGRVIFTFEVPTGCRARIILPDGREEKVVSGRYEYEV